MKKYTKLFLVCSFLILVGTICNPVQKAHAGKDYKWEPWVTGKVIDIDPIYYNNEFGIMIHFKNASWAVIWTRQFVNNSRPTIAETGTLYRSKKIKGAIYWKWKEHKIKSKSKSKPKPIVKAIPKVETISVEYKPVSEWQKYSTLPEKDKIVVVKFDDNLTSTAYVNKYGEWKLDINRKDYKGGKTLINIVKWKDIGI